MCNVTFGEKNLEKLLDILIKKNLSCIIERQSGEVREVTGAGIAPTILLLEDGMLEGSMVIDKIIGKAAAMLMSLGKVRYVYGVVMSKSAAEWLEEHRIPFSFGTLVDHIVNRVGTGICPMEETVQLVSDGQTALFLLKKKLQELRKAN